MDDVVTNEVLADDFNALVTDLLVFSNNDKERQRKHEGSRQSRARKLIAIEK